MIITCCWHTWLHHMILDFDRILLVPVGCFSLPAFDCGSLSRTSCNDEAATICCPTGTDATYMDGISSYKVRPLYPAKQLHRKTWKLIKRSLNIDFETRLRLYIIPLHTNVVHTTGTVITFVVFHQTKTGDQADVMALNTSNREIAFLVSASNGSGMLWPARALALQHDMYILGTLGLRSGTVNTR